MSGVRTVTFPAIVRRVSLRGRRYNRVDPAKHGPLPSTSNPLLAPQIRREEDAAKIRRLTCVRYGDCLTKASDNGWKGFTCRSCGVRETIDQEQAMADRDGFTDMWQRKWMLAGATAKRI